MSRATASSQRPPGRGLPCAGLRHPGPNNRSSSISSRNAQTRFFGDCTRINGRHHGCIPDPIARMHRAVCHAKRAAERTLRAGVGGGAVHAATIEVIHGHGFESGFLRDGEDTARCAMVHGTTAVDLMSTRRRCSIKVTDAAGDAVTISSSRAFISWGWGVRVEDLYIVQASGSINLNQLLEQLAVLMRPCSREFRVIIRSPSTLRIVCVLIPIAPEVKRHEHCSLVFDSLGACQRQLVQRTAVSRSSTNTRPRGQVIPASDALAGVSPVCGHPQRQHSGGPFKPRFPPSRR